MNLIFKQIQVFLCHHGSALILSAAKLASEGANLANRVGSVAIKDGEPCIGQAAAGFIENSATTF